MPKISTIKLSTETKERLLKLKEHERETFDEVLNKMLYILNVCKKEPEKAKKILENIDKRIKRIQIFKKRIKSVNKIKK
jgi:hypothetical protein